MSTASSEWLDELCSDFLNKYCHYLESLNFVHINESTPLTVSPKKTRHGRSQESTATVKSEKPSQLYQCFQRSWPGGIMLVDITFLQKKIFHVRLFSLESTRLDEEMFQSVSPKVLQNYSQANKILVYAEVPTTVCACIDPLHLKHNMANMLYLLCTFSQ